MEYSNPEHKTDQSSSLPFPAVGSSLSLSGAPVAFTRHGRIELLHSEPILCLDVCYDPGLEVDGEEILEDSDPGDVICIIPLIINILFR